MNTLFNRIQTHGKLDMARHSGGLGIRPCDGHQRVAAEADAPFPLRAVRVCLDAVLADCAAVVDHAGDVSGCD